jgi:hypothetical protein
MYAGETAEQMRTPPEPTGTWVDDVLESDQLYGETPHWATHVESENSHRPLDVADLRALDAAPDRITNVERSPCRRVKQRSRTPLY